MNKQNAAGIFLAYHWMMLKTSIGFPTILDEKYTLYATLIFVGFWLSRSHFSKLMDKMEEEYSALVDYLNTKVEGSKILTSWGCYNWDGITYKEDINGDTYCIFWEGVNYLGAMQRGDRVFICPENHVKEMGKHRLLKTKFEWVKLNEIPAELESMVYGATYVFQGDVVSSIFEKVDPNLVDLRRQVQSQTVLSNELKKNNSELSKLISDAVMLLKSTQANETDDREFDKMIASLEGTQ